MRGKFKWGGYMYTYDWFMLRFDRKQWNSVKQLFFNLKKKELKRNYDADKYNCNENLTGGAQHIWTKKKKKSANLKISLLRCVIACSREQCISLRSLNSQPSPTFFFKSHSAMSNSLWLHRLYSTWNSPGQNTEVGSLFLLQGIFPAQGSNPGLPHCREIIYQLSHKGSPKILEWVAYPFSRGSSRPRNWTGVSCFAGGFFTNWAVQEAPHRCAK